MELFIRDIPRSARKEDVQLAISNALHGGAYSDLSTDPINFEFWFHTKANVAHRGTGSLTLPEQNIGRAFLARHGTQLSINGGRVMVSVSRNPARPHVVETLRRIPYKDPWDEAEQQIVALEKDLATKFKIENIKQGWMDRDGKFLSEYSISAANNPQIEDITLRIDDDTRSILLELSMRATDPAPTPNSDFLSMLSLLGSGSRRKLSYTIRFRYSDIYRITHDQAQGNSTRRILFQLKSPVSYEYFEDCGFSEFFGSSNPPQKKRLSSLTFDARHKELANVVSKTILIRLKQEDALQFKKLCKLGQIGRVRNGTIYAASSDSFSGSGLLSLRRWINGNKWEIAFQLERILTSMLLNPEEFNAIRPAIDELIATSSTSQVCAVLLDFIARLGVLDRGEDWEEEPPAIAECLERAKIQVRHPVADVPRLRQTKKNDLNAEFPCLHVVVTPTRFILEGPAPEQLNRVLRMYPNNWRNFLRVRFTDEDQNQFRWERDIDGAAFVRERVGGILKNGLTVAGRHFEYLGYSNSSLKSHTVWFVHPFEDPERGMQDAKAIIKRLGNFSRDIQCPARMGARIAQAFSSTDLSVTATAEELIKIPDIERNGSCFTDGVGTISPEFAEQIWESLTKLRKKRSYFLPAAYQIRLGGYKGMLAIDYRLEGSVVCVRDSMDKFDSPSVDVEVSRAFDRPGETFCFESLCFLNRPLIMGLETANKVPVSTFLMLQRRAVRDTKAMMETFDGAARVLESHGLGTAYRIPMIFLRLKRLGFELEHCVSLGVKTVLKDAETDILRDLKYHARIPVPDSWKLVGIADEFNYLQEGQIYACVHDRDDEPIYLEGRFIITRSPVIHPGDVQVVTAIGKPPPGTPFDKEPLANAVVLSCQGNRSLASCLGGGDLDGDLYDLINLTAWPELAPRVICAPAAYPPVTKKLILGTATIEHVKTFICDYINSDILGVIATRHLRLADVRDLGATDPDCLKLAELHSKAVDFQKSGTPVSIRDLPYEGKMRPDWDLGEISGRRRKVEVYRSERALGQLYRDIELKEDQLQIKGTHPDLRFGETLDVTIHARPLERAKYDFITHRLRESLALYIDVDRVPSNALVEAVGLLQDYVSELARICNDYALSSRSMLSEEEVVAGTILERTSQRRRRTDMISEMRTASTTLADNVKEVLRGSDSDSLEKWATRSWAAYQVAKASETFGRKSFGLLALGNAFDAMDAIVQRNRDRVRRIR